ncbi:MAG: tetratricopeptide repeat protein [Candidatus Magnetominusculus sp. LBB02]|nr:tetratricopeptide repeat protein [Candidatus Magnetominusculus sp. LBB02]
MAELCYYKPLDGLYNVIMNYKRSHIILICLLLAALSCLVYLPVLNNGFVSYDDGVEVLENYHVMEGLTWKGIAWAFTHTYDSNWIPLTWASYMLDVELYGTNAAGAHMTSVIIHTFSVVMLFLFLYFTTRNTLSSAFVAAVFAVHPLNVESVAWVSDRKNVLSTFFWIAALCAYAAYARRNTLGRPLRAYYAAALVLLILGLMSKSMLVTFPFTLLLLDYWPLRRLTSRADVKRLVVEKLPFFFFAALFIFITLYAQRDSIAGFEQLPLKTRILSALTSYVSYIGKMAAPTDLAVFYPYRPIKSLWPAAASALLLISITTAAFVMRKNRPYLIVGWFWYMGTMAPVIQIVQVGLAPMADRYAYVPLIGIFTMCSWGLWDVLERGCRRSNTLFISTAILITAIFSAFTWRQVGYWRDSGTLFKHALDVTQSNYAAHNSYGVHLLKQNRFDEALKEFYDGLEVMPDDPLLNFNAWSTLTYLGRNDEARKFYAKSLPYWKEGRQPHLYKLLAIDYMKEKRYEEAILYFRKSLEIAPKELDTINYMGLALMSIGKNEEALSYFNGGLAINSRMWEIVFNKGLALLALGRVSEAASAFRETLALNPNYEPAKGKLAILDSARGDR